MEKSQSHIIIKSVGEWNLYESLVWRDMRNLHRCQFFIHERNPSKLLAIIEWIEPGSEYHSIIEFYCDPADDPAKLKFVEEFIANVEAGKIDENQKESDSFIYQLKASYE